MVPGLFLAGYLSLIKMAYDAWTLMYDTVHQMDAVPVGVKELATLLVYMRVGWVSGLSLDLLQPDPINQGARAPAEKSRAQAWTRR